MKNSIANIPFLKAWVNYFSALKHQFKSRKLKIGYLNNLKNCQFGFRNALGDNVKLSHVLVGDFSYISDETSIRNTTIGKYTSIGPRCQIGLGKHPTSGYLSTHPLFYSNNTPLGYSILNESTFKEFEPIRIGNDVWIGANVIILDGVEIGDGAIIAAGAIVTKNVAPFSIVKGIPAQHTKFRFSEVEIKDIEANPWWEKDATTVQSMIKEQLLK